MSKCRNVFIVMRKLKITSKAEKLKYTDNFDSRRGQNLSLNRWLLGPSKNCSVKNSALAHAHFSLYWFFSLKWDKSVTFDKNRKQMSAFGCQMSNK